MSRYKIILTLSVLFMSAMLTIVTMYFYGRWQHDRYWNGTIVRVNEAESNVCSKLLTTNISDIYAKRDFFKLKEILRPLEGKLLIRIRNQNGYTVFESGSSENLGKILQESNIQTNSAKYTLQIFDYKPPAWNSRYMSWFLNVSQWFSIKYDSITIPAVFFLLIWSLFFTALIWRYKSRMDNERLFHVLREFPADKDEKKLE